jgi:hypothetical protein
MINRVAQGKILRKPRTLQNIPIAEQRLRDKMDSEYCLRCVEQARKRAKVDPLYQTYRRLSDLITDQHIRFSDPMAADSPAQIYAASRVVQDGHEPRSRSYHYPGERTRHPLDTKLSKGETLNVQEEIAYAVGRYELTKAQKRDIRIRDYYMDIQEASRVRTDEEKQHHRTIVECMKGDIERSLRKRCEELTSKLLEMWKCIT